MIVTLEDLASVRARHKNKKIVLAAGTFDIFHAGHWRHYLKDLSSYGDLVVVLVNSDLRIKVFKGEKRPINSENDRAEVVNALKGVDYVFVLPGKEKRGSIDTVFNDLKPDIFVTTNEGWQENKEIMGDTELIILPRAGSKNLSTTAIINRIVELHKQ